MIIDELIGAAAQLLLMSLLPLLFWMICGRKNAHYLEYVGLRKPVTSKNSLAAVFFVIIGMLVYCFGMYIFSGMAGDEVTLAGSQFAGSGFKGIPAVLIYGYIRTGLSEEIFFRGFILKRIQSKFGYQTGNIIQGLLFGLMHGIPFGLAAKNIAIAIALTILPGAVGYLQGWMNEKKFGGSIVPSWLLHGTMNTAVALISLF